MHKCREHAPRETRGKEWTILHSYLDISGFSDDLFYGADELFNMSTPDPTPLPLMTPEPVIAHVTAPDAVLHQSHQPQLQRTLHCLSLFQTVKHTLLLLHQSPQIDHQWGDHVELNADGSALENFQKTGG